MEGGRLTASSSKFTWRILNFSKSTVKKLYSDTFIAGDCKWRLLIFPKGNNVDYLSIYLDVADAPSLPNGWNRDAKFILAVVNQFNTMATVKKETQKLFTAGEADWGFTSFIPLSKIKNPAERYLVNDTLIIEAEVLVHSAVHYSVNEKQKEPVKSEPKAPDAPALPKKEAIVTEAKVVPPTVTDTPLPTKPLQPTEPVIQVTPGVAHQEAKKEPAPAPELVPPHPVTEEPKVLPKDLTSEPTENVQKICKGLLTQISSRNKSQKSASSNEISVSSDAFSPDVVQHQKEALKGFFSMSLEAIQQVNAFGYIEGIIRTLVQHANDLREKMILEDLASRLAEFKESIKNATTIAETAQTQRMSLTGKTIDLDTKLEQRRKELSSLESEFSKISEEEAKLQAALRNLISQKNSIALKLEKSNQETSKDLEEWQNLQGEMKQANAEWLGAKERLALANVRWKLYKEDLGLGKLNIA